MIRKTAIILIVLFSFNKLYSQAIMQYIEAESDFKELKIQLRDKGNSLQNIENAFLNWDYKLLEPLLDKEIREDTKNFFKTHHDSIVKYDWKKKTHYGPNFSGIPGGSFGLIDKSNDLRVHTTNQNNKVFEISYSCYVKDSTLHIYSLRSSKYPFKDRLNTTTPNV